MNKAVPKNVAPKRLKSWFTLAELIVVVVILAILATVWFVSLSWYSDDARDAAIKTNIRSIQSAIAAESAVTGNSPRYYVIHDSAYALSWAFAYVDGTGIALTGGQWDATGTNYSAGSPDFVKLRLNPDKFKIARAPSWRSFASEAAAAYDPTSAMVWAADFHIAKASGSSRPVSFFQTAAVVPSTKLAVVAGNFPEAEVPSGYVSGLLRSHPGSAQNLTDFVVEGKPVSVPVETATPEPEPEPEPEVPAFVSTTWDTGMAIDWLTFDSSGTTFTETNGAVSPVRSVGSHSTGKWYWEIKPSLESQWDVWLWVISSSAPTNNNIWAWIGWAHWRSEGQLYINNVWSFPSWYSYEYAKDPTVLMFALDADTGKYWIGKNCSWYASWDPSSGTSPHATLPTSTNWKVSYLTEGRHWANVIKANFWASSFACSVPTGFNPGF